MDINSLYGYGWPVRTKIVSMDIVCMDMVFMDMFSMDIDGLHIANCSSIYYLFLITNVEHLL